MHTEYQCTQLLYHMAHIAYTGVCIQAHKEVAVVGDKRGVTHSHFHT